MSALGWIVGSLRERDAALALLQSDMDAEPRDELGMGPLRDVLANAFFPGVTTLQTRAKYFLFVPRMYQELEREQHARAPAARRILQLEESLLEAFHGSGEHGVIGSQRWRVPQNPASGIYWSGLHTWRIRLFKNTRPHYHRWLDGGRRVPLASSSDDDRPTEGSRWHEPPDTEELLTEPTMALRRSHAEFLRDRILGIRDRPERALLKDLASAGPFPDGTAFWDLAAAREAALGELVADAGLSSVALHGAMLLYNLRCAELKDATAVGAWRERLNAWSGQHPRQMWREWDLAAFWDRVRPLDGGRAEWWTAPFVAPWVAELRRHAPGSGTALQLVAGRELFVKPGRARTAGAETLAGWNPDVGVAAEPLTFRWPEARTILNDIDAGLTGTSGT
jgi:hypothetical protein